MTTPVSPDPDPRLDRRARMDPPGWAPVPDPTLLTFSLVDREVAHVKEIVDLQFSLIERQRVESKRDTENALAAALTSQEKAAGVLATFTSDQLKALSTAFTSAIEQVRKDIAELKEGTKADRGRLEGSREQVTEHRQGNAAVYAAVGVAVAVLSLLMAFSVYLAAKP